MIPQRRGVAHMRDRRIRHMPVDVEDFGRRFEAVCLKAAGVILAVLGLAMVYMGVL